MMGLVRGYGLHIPMPLICSGLTAGTIVGIRHCIRHWIQRQVRIRLKQSV